VLCAFKIVTIGLILVAAGPRDYLFPMLVAFNWPWLIPLGLVLSVIPFGFWVRLVRARARRRKLQHSEWNVDRPAGAPLPGQVRRIQWSDSRGSS
jgi:hypothetical protein